MNLPLPTPLSCGSRRAVLRQLAAAGLTVAGGASRAAAEKPAPPLPPPPAARPPGEDVTFYVVADPQIHLDKWGAAGTEATLRTLNELPGQPFPLGGAVGEPRAVLVAGDLVDVIDDPRHWEHYAKCFDPNGAALLRYRAFEGIGNHDLSTAPEEGFSAVQQAVIQRHRRLKGPEVIHWDAHHYHYSWDWGPLHLVMLNLFPGNEARPVYDRAAPWNNPRRSLDFLRQDLSERVGTSGRPVILVWHYGLRGWGLEKWWTPEDLANLRAVLAPYQISLIIHGHEHAFAHYEWEGYPVFMCPSPQLDRPAGHPEVPSTPKGFLVVRLRGDQLQLAHHAADGWRETWARPVDRRGR